MKVRAGDDAGRRDRDAFLASAFAAMDEGDHEREELARRAYRALLPRRAISRSPDSGALVEIQFDATDLDGFWWDAYRPERPGTTGGLPAEVVSFAGAMQLSKPVAHAPFLASPGPAVPFVHPELLGADGVVAVVSSIRVGPHIGFPIMYFARAVPAAVPLLDWWGARSYRYGPADAVVEGSNPGFEGDWDFDLAPWVRIEKLQWIAPDDEAWEVRRGLKGCPYLDLPGERLIARVQGGEVWRSTPS